MNIKVKDGKKLKVLAKKYYLTPYGPVDYFIEALPAAHNGFDNVAKKTSFRRGLAMALWNAATA